MSFQGAINNILNQAAITGRAVKYASSQEQAIQDSKQKSLEQEQAKVLESQQAEQRSIAETNSKIDEAIKMSIGYTDKDIRAQQAGEALGINNPQKNPRGVSNKTFERRTANANAMREILTRASQSADFRERLEKFSSKDISKALNPQIRTRKAKGESK